MTFELIFWFRISDNGHLTQFLFERLFLSCSYRSKLMLWWSHQLETQWIPKYFWTGTVWDIAALFSFFVRLLHIRNIHYQVHHKENESIFPAQIDILKRWMEPLSFRSIMWLSDHYHHQWVSLATTAAATQRTRRTLDQPEAIAANRTRVNRTGEDAKVLWKKWIVAKILMKKNVSI